MSSKQRELVMLANMAPLATAKAEDLWRILLMMADAATPEGEITEKEWLGICRTCYLLYRADNPRLRPGAVIEVQGVPCLVFSGKPDARDEIEILIGAPGIPDVPAGTRDAVGIVWARKAPYLGNAADAVEAFFRAGAG